MNLTEAKRAWIYRVLVAGSAVAVGYGLLTTEEAGLWLGLAAAALIGNGLAAKNTSTSTTVDIDAALLPYDPEHTTGDRGSVNPTAVVDAIRRFERTHGAGWRGNP